MIQTKNNQFPLTHNPDISFGAGAIDSPPDTMFGTGGDVLNPHDPNFDQFVGATAMLGIELGDLSVIQLYDPALGDGFHDHYGSPDQN